MRKGLGKIECLEKCSFTLGRFNNVILRESAAGALWCWLDSIHNFPSVIQGKTEQSLGGGKHNLSSFKFLEFLLPAGGRIPKPSTSLSSGCSATVQVEVDRYELCRPPLPA